MGEEGGAEGEEVERLLGEEHKEQAEAEPLGPLREARRGAGRPRGAAHAGYVYGLLKKFCSRTKEISAVTKKKRMYLFLRRI